MLDIFAQYAVDPKLEQEGKEFDFGGGVKLLIARAQNAAYTRMLNQQIEAHKHTLDLKETDEQLAAARSRSDKIMAYVMAHTVLIGWSGPVAYKGEVLEYSVANAQKLLEIPEFQREIAKRADDFRNYRYEVEAADAKN